MKTYSSFAEAINDNSRILLQMGHTVNPRKWQSMNVSQRADASMLEILNVSFQVAMPTTDLDHYRKDIKPNLPWADHHFETERVSGHPVNPGWTWKEWPWGLSADKFRTTKQGAFSHSYAERYWSKHAGMTEDGILPPEEDGGPMPMHKGIRFPYGDLSDVVARLVDDRDTRQAVLAVWHPEDQFNHGERVPCSLTYHFLHRFGYLHVVYQIRSCDALRHFRDDIYLTVRLLLWVLERCRALDSVWNEVNPGLFVMHITSFHCFVGDHKRLSDETRS